MAVSIRSCLGVDIGSHCIRLAQMELGKAGPRVVSLIESPIEVDAGLAEAERYPLIAKQIQDLLKKNHIRTKNAVFCVPGQSVFVRRIKLPRANPEHFRRMLRFEARDQIPFPLDKTILEYQIFDEPGEPEVSVLLVAIKRDYIVNFMKMVNKAGLRPIGISVSSLALYNFHNLNNSTLDLSAEAAKPKNEKKKAKPKKGEEAIEEIEESPEEAGALEVMDFEEIDAYVNMGASLMDLSIPRPGPLPVIGFTRSVPLAGNQMDRVIMNKLGLDDIAEARRIKENETAVLSTEFEIEGDPEAVNMDSSEAVTGVCDRLIAELRRSLDFFISQPDGVAVDRLVISGGLTRLKYLASYIEEKMGVPVEVAQVRHPQLRMPETVPDNFSGFCIAVGLALQGLRLGPLTIDFLPEDIKSVRGLQERKLEMVAIVAMLLVFIGMSFNIGSQYVSRYQEDTRRLQDKMTKVETDDKAIKKAQSRDDKVFEAYEKLSTVSGDRTFWPEFAKAVVGKRPGDVLIDDMYMRIDGTVIITGRAPLQASVNDFVDELKTLEDLIPTARIEKIQQVRDSRFRQPVYDYQILMRTKIRFGRVRSLGMRPSLPEG